MSEDNCEGCDCKSESADAEGASITLTEAIEESSELAGEEADGFEGEVPNHAPGLIVERASELIGTVRNIEMATESEQAPTPEEDQVADAIEADAVNILLAIGTLDYEYEGLDIAAAFEERLDTIKAFQAFEEAVEDAETQEEVMAAMDEHLDEEMQGMAAQQMMGGMQSPVEPGDNVDDEDYDHDEEGRSFQ